MGDRIDLYVLAGAVVVGLLMSAYNVFLHAPAVVAARPELADLGFWTALFSGRFVPWAFYNHPIASTIIDVSFWVVIGFAVIWTARK